MYFFCQLKYFLVPKRGGGGGGGGGDEVYFFPYPLIWDKNKRTCVN